MTLAERIDSVRARMDAACARAGRNPEEVTLVAISKRMPASDVAEAFEAGLRHFGENYAQELREKSEALAHLRGLRWHQVGPLQRNKAKYVAQRAHAFHALDRPEIALELSRRRTGDPLRCFLEVNLGGETTKSGVAPEHARALLDRVSGLPGLEVLGLMALPPPGDSAEASRPHFGALRLLAERLGLKGLSMGTSDDYEVAIEEGATHVRVGTAIFGPRPKLKSP